MSSSFQFDHNRLFADLENALKNDLASIQVEANGGRSILFVYPCDDDDEYIVEGRRRLSPDLFTFIDIREIFADYVNEIGEDNFKEMEANFGKEVYRSENSPEGTFFAYLMDRISAVLDSGHSPVLVHTGTLYDMEFSNIHIMEEDQTILACGAGGVSKRVCGGNILRTFNVKSVEEYLARSEEMAERKRKLFE